MYIYSGGSGVVRGVPKLKKALQSYIDSCPSCQLSKPSRRLPYGQLHPIETSKEPLSELSMDFIVGLPETPEGYNCLGTVTDRFSKYVRLIPGKETWGAKDWAEIYHTDVHRYWGMPASIITDRDPRFTSDFWTCVFQKSGVKLGLTTAMNGVMFLGYPRDALWLVDQKVKMKREREN